MDNPINKLITKDEVENILNHFGNLGKNDTKLLINSVEIYQIAFVHESYYMSVVKNILHKNKEVYDNYKIFLNYIPKCSNERLEFLGDNILKSILGKYIYSRFGEEREAFLTTLKIKLEKGTALHKFAKILNFKKWLLLSLQVENETILDMDRGRNQPDYYENAFEAFIGALVEDFNGDITIAENFIINIIENTINFSDLISNNENYKDLNQRVFQAQNEHENKDYKDYKDYKDKDNKDYKDNQFKKVKKWKNPEYINVDEFTSNYNQKIFTKCVLITEDQLNDISKFHSKEKYDKIKDYTINILVWYKNNNPEIFEKLLELLSNQDNSVNYILGLSKGKKVILAEQNCAKICLQNLGVKEF